MVFWKKWFIRLDCRLGSEVRRSEVTKILIKNVPNLGMFFFTIHLRGRRRTNFWKNVTPKMWQNIQLNDRFQTFMSYTHVTTRLKTTRSGKNYVIIFTRMSNTILNTQINDLSRNYYDVILPWVGHFCSLCVWLK